MIEFPQICNTRSGPAKLARVIPVSDIKVTETDQILLLLVLCTLEKDVAQNVIASVFTPISPGERQDVRLEKPRFAKDRLNLIAVETYFHKKPFYFQVDFFLGKFGSKMKVRR